MTERMQTLRIDSDSALSPGSFVTSLLNLGLVPKCIELAVKYDIAIYVRKDADPVNVNELAKKLNLNGENLKRILSFLASYGIFLQQENCNDFVGNEMSEMLIDGCTVDMIRLLARHENQLARLEMANSVKTGEPTFGLANGASFYHYSTNHPDFQRIFDAAMAEANDKMQEKLVEVYDFSRFDRICEIGGGRGGLLLKILKRNPKTNCVLFERAAVIPNIFCELHTDEELKNRFKAVCGDAIFGVDVEADLYVISNTLVNFDDSDAMTIVINCGIAMAKRNKDLEKKAPARLLIVEPDFKQTPPNEPSLLKQGFDLAVMYLIGGTSRTKQRWQERLELCGMDVCCMTDVPPFYMAMECHVADEDSATHIKETFAYHY